MDIGLNKYYVRSVLVVLVLSIVTLSCTKIPRYDLEKMAEAEALCAKIPVPDSLRKTRDRKINRGSHGVVSAWYTTSSDTMSLEEAVKRTFSPKDKWRFSEEESSAERILTFSKESWKINVGIYSTWTKQKRVSVSCSWK